MFKLSAMHHKLLKQIKKYPNGISSELLIKKNNNNSFIKFALFELKDENYLSQLISEEDKLKQIFELEVTEYSGNWVLTDKALVYLKNNKLEFKLKLINRVIGFFLGVATTLLAQLLLHFIFLEVQ